MKTTEGIKQTLEQCSHNKCANCVYFRDGCASRLMRDALEYINELEAKAPRLGDMGELIKMLRTCQHDQCICDECAEGSNVKHWRQLMGMAADALEAIAVDAEPVRHGKCELCGRGKPIKAFTVLPECGLQYGPSIMARYCPNCGAKMDGEEE